MNNLTNLIKFNSSEQKKTSIIFLLITLYFLLSPFEDIMNFGAGTILKYLAALIVLLIIFKSILLNYTFNFLEPLFLLPILLIFISWISIIWSTNVEVTLSRNVTYTLLPLFFIALQIINFSPKEKKMLRNTVIFSGVFVIIFVLYRLDDSFYRITLYEGTDPNNLAAYLVLPLFILIQDLFSISKKNKVSLLIIGIIFFTFAIFFTGSRGAIIAIIIGVLYIFFTELKFKNIAKIIFVSLVIIFIIYQLVSFLPDNLSLRIFNFQSYFRDLDEYGSRTDIWRNIYYNLFPKMPFLGYGSGVPPYIISQYYGYPYGVHNTYINMFLEYGIIGITTFLVFIYYLYRRVRFSKDIQYVGALIAILIIIFFLDSYPKKFFWNTLIFVFLTSTKYESRNVRL